MNVHRGAVDLGKGNSTLEKIYLNVFATNQEAIQLYKNLGFVEEGRFIKSDQATKWGILRCDSDVC